MILIMTAIKIYLLGRVLPNEYPFAPNSYLLENNGKGIFKDVTDEKAPGLKKMEWFQMPFGLIIMETTKWI